MIAALLVGAAAYCAPRAVPTLFIAGDSTAARYSGANPQEGWGEPIAKFFDPGRLRVVNAARGGRSSRTFITEGHWERVLAEVRAGDFVIIQFGHNDDGALNREPPGSGRPLRARGTIPGVGDEYAEIDNVLTGQHETRYQRIGPAAVKSQFGIDTVHTNPAGAEANAADVIAGLRALRGLDFRSKLSAAGRTIRADAGPQKSSACPAL